MVLREKMIPCQSREAVLSVCSYENGRMDACLRHPRLDGYAEVQSLSQVLLLLDSLVDLEDCPGRFMPVVSSDCGGGKNTDLFRIQIFFREHYTWQGRLIWENKNEEAVFHSALDLMRLLDEILAE